jgi:hypothetical protein
MRKTTVLFLALLTVAALALPLASAQEKGSWTGWITDDTCGAKGAKAEHKDCAKKCLNDGGRLVFYNTDDHKIYKIADQEQAKQFLGYEVIITGSIADTTYLEVESITRSGK